MKFLKNPSLMVKCLIFFSSILFTLAIYLTYQFFSLRSKNFTSPVKKCDCIVVLGAAVWPGGKPSPVFADRLSRTAELYQEKVASKIICSGGLGKNPPTEAEVGREFLINAGVKAEDIIMESVSTSTAEQVKRIKQICDQQGFSSIAVVTSFFHETRALLLFHRAGIKEAIAARCTHLRFQDLNYWVAREALALASLTRGWIIIATIVGFIVLQLLRLWS